MLKIYYEGLKNFVPWGTAIDTMEKIREADKLNEFEQWLENHSEGNINQTDLNDLLVFQSEIIFDDLQIPYEKEI